MALTMQTHCPITWRCPRIEFSPNRFFLTTCVPLRQALIGTRPSCLAHPPFFLLFLTESPPCI